MTREQTEAVLATGAVDVGSMRRLEGLSALSLKIARAVRRIDRWSERPGFGIESDPLGPWLKREDVLRVVDEAIRGG